MAFLNKCRLSRWSLVLLLTQMLFVIAFSSFSEEADAATGSYQPVASTEESRASASSFLLPDGRALLLGGRSGTVSQLSDGKLFDPFTNSWATIAPSGVVRDEATATRLADGRFLVIGGWGDSSVPAQIYDPVSDSWQEAGEMGSWPTSYAAVLLADGRVLVCGGNDWSGTLIATSQLYDPATNSWSSAPGMAQARVVHTATLLPSGKVLVAGGGLSAEFPYNGSSTVTAELYDPVVGTWSPAANLSVGRGLHQATVIAGGKVLVTGGVTSDYTGLQQAEIYDPAADAWTSAGNLTYGRYDHSATLLNDGKVLVAGGGSDTTTEIFDPATGVWEVDATLTQPFFRHAATVMLNGQVLLAGGWGYPTGSAGLYTPAGLDPAPPRSLSVTMTAGGLVRSTPAHIECLEGVCSADFLYGSTIQLIATETPGQVFTGWTGCDSATANKCSVIMNANRSVTARFETGPARFLPAASLPATFNLHTTTLLPNGKVLLVGARYGDLLYDAALRTWTTTGNSYGPHSRHTATLLSDGKVLVAGGDPYCFAGPYARVYDPNLDNWRSTERTVSYDCRYGHAAARLTDGRVLVTGGVDRYDHPLSETEIYNPVTDSWSSASSMQRLRHFHTATPITGGRVLVVGGDVAAGPATVAVEIYDAATNTWSYGPAPAVNLSGHTATSLADGRVLIVGGAGAGMESAEIFDPVTNAWSPAGNAITARTWHTASLLPSGKVLVAGGTDGNGAELASAEVYDPETNSWSVAAPMYDQRKNHSAAVLQTGEVLVTGGNNSGVELATAELYSPGALPEDTVAPSSVITSPVPGPTYLNLITGTADDGAGTGVRRVEVSIDGGSTWGTAIGTVSWQYGALVPNGQYTVVSRAIDYAGNVEVPGAGVQVTVFAPLSIAVSTPVPGASVPGNFVTVTGTANSFRAFEKIEVTIDGGATWQVATGWQNWSCALPSQPEGSYTAQARVLDQAGNVALSAPVGFTIGAYDTVSPVTVAEIACLKGADGACTSNATITLQAADGDSGVSFTEYRIGEDGNWKNYSAPFIITAQGGSRIYFRSVDRSNNREDTKTVEVDVKTPSWQDAGLYGGRISQIAFSSGYANDRTVFAAGAVDSIYRSVDGGTNWSPLSAEIFGHSQVRAIAVSPRYESDRTIFVGTSDLRVYRSVDAGASWQIVAVMDAGIADIKISPYYDNDGTVFVSAIKSDGLYRSSNGGLSFQKVSTAGLGAYVRTLALSPNFALDHTMYGALSPEMKRSSDGGNTWSTCTAIDGDQGSNYIQSVVVADDGTVFVIDGTGRTRSSTDGCQSWSTGVLNGGMGLAVSPDFAVDRTVISGRSRSTDGGLSWTPVLGVFVNVAAVSPSFADDGVVLAGIDNDIVRSTDRGTTWVSSTTGITGVNISDIVVSPDFENDRTLFAAGNPGGLYRSSDGGTTWTIASPDAVSVSISPSFATDGTVYAVGLASVYRSTDRGLSWSYVMSAPMGKYFNEISFSPAFASDSTIFLTGMSYSGLSHYLYGSTDGGATWVERAAFAGRYAKGAVAVSPSFATDATIFVSTNSALHRSTDGGLNWTSASPVSFIYSIVISPDYASDRKVYIGTENGLYRSTDGGATWQAMRNAGLLATTWGEDPDAIHTLKIIDGLGGRVIFAGTGSGVFQSLDEGDTWSGVNAGLTGASVRSLALSPNYLNDGKIFCGGYFGGIRVGAPAAVNVPVASFTGTPFSGYAPLFVQLSDTTLNSPDNWSWEFGDGGRSNERNAFHIFEDAGDYQVKLTVSNASGTHVRDVPNQVRVLACPNLPVRTSDGFFYGSIQEAFDSAGQESTVFAQAKTLSGDVLLSRDVNLSLKGGYDCGYTINPAAVTIRGALKVAAGTLKVERVAFK